MFIGISGKGRSGKDTFAKMLAGEFSKKIGKPYVLMAYAAELKKKVQKDFDLSWEQLWGDEKEVPDKRYPKKQMDLPFCIDKKLEVIGETYWTPREILQDYGQFFRVIYNNFWVNHLFKIIDDKEYKNVIITDVRHINEVDAVVDRGGFHVRILRDDKDAIHGEQHISETALDNGHRVDFEVANNWGLIELKVAASEVAVFLTSQKGVNKILEV